MKKEAITTSVVLASLVFALLRIAGEKSEIFQALAHIWVGLLFGGWLMGLLADKIIHDHDIMNLMNGYDVSTSIHNYGKLLLRTAVVISLIELACFIVGTFK
jgi:hypothetical protein